MTALTFPFVVIGVLLTALLFGFGVRRLLGLRLSPLRALLGGVVALACGSPIITAIGGSVLTHKGSVLPGVWFVILGAAIALLIGMLVLVIAEALVPSGTMPGPLYLIRVARKRARRARRYSQITGILARRGVLPCLRGSRRAELQTHDGRARLARSLRLTIEDGGVTFVKLGQILATRRDLLPAELIDELSGLQDDAGALATIEGTLSQLAPGFDILAQARSFATQHAAAQLNTTMLRKSAIDELISLVPMLRRLPRRPDRISGSLEAGRLGVKVRLLADPGDRRYLTGLVHQLVLTFLAATCAVTSVLMLGLHGGPSVTQSVTL